MQDLSSVDVHFIARELQELVSSKVEKIYQDGNQFQIRLFTKKGKQKLRIIVPGLINITVKEHTFPTIPQGFSMFLRKYLTNTIISKIYQKEFERIIIFEFDTIEHGTLSLIIELFKPGNLILCKTEGKSLHILNPLTRKTFKDRKIAAKQPYEFPPFQRNVNKLSVKEIIKIHNESKKTLVKSLATEFALGGIYAEEIISRTGLPKEQKEISEKEARLIHNSLKGMLAEKISAFSFDGRIYPFDMKSVPVKNATFGSFSEALDTASLEEKPEKKDTRQSKQIESQEKRIIELEKDIAEYQKTGEFIYENYQEFKTLLDKVKELRKKKSFKEIKELLKENKHFKELNEKEKKIILEF